MTQDDKKNLKSELDKVDMFYDVGDFKRARQLSHQLIDDHPLEDSDRNRIDRVLAATRTDPMAIGAIVFTVALMVYIFVRYAV
jgi:hypothetical protein